LLEVCTRRELIAMKILGWVLLGCAVTGLAFWMVISPWFPRNPAAELLVWVVFGAPGAGAFWMLYMSIRYEEHPLPMILLAFVPCTFLWYYFEKVRTGKYKTRVVTA